MLPVRLFGNSVKLSGSHLIAGGPKSLPLTSSRSKSTLTEPNDWANQTVDTIASEGISFTETRKHKMDGDTVYHQNLDQDQYESLSRIDSSNDKQDGRFHVYDPSSIGLSGVMQTNVPEPFDPTIDDNQEAFLVDHAASLNMPGGSIGQKTKYLSGQLNMLDIDQSRH